MAPISEQFKLSLAILMLKPHKYIPMYCNKVPTGLLALFQDYKHLFLILYAYIFALRPIPLSISTLKTHKKAPLVFTQAELHTNFVSIKAPKLQALCIIEFYWLTTLLSGLTGCALSSRMFISKSNSSTRIAFSRFLL